MATVPLTPDQLSVIRSWVGSDTSDPTDGDIQARYIRLLDIDATVLEILRSKLADLLNQPAQISLPDGTQIAISDNITEVRKQIQQFLEFGGTGIDDESASEEEELPGEFHIIRMERDRPHWR